MIKLGLCKPPEAIYLYVNAGEEGTHLWHQYDIDKQESIPVHDRGLCGHLQELKLTTKEYKGKENVKLDIVISADETYVIRSGIETNFAKTFLLAIAEVADLKKPLIFAVTPGDEKVVFCRLYDGESKQRVKAQWNKDADWNRIVAGINQKLGHSLPQEQPRTQPQSGLPQPTIDKPMLMKEIGSLCDRKSVTASQLQVFLKKFGALALTDLSDRQLVDFRDRLSIWQQPVMSNI